MSPKALILLAAALFSTAALLQGCGGGGAGTSSTIPDLAGKTAELSTLVTALKAADLVSTLAATGPFTVFAPTNDAFKALPAGVLSTLLEPANIKALQQVLKYHVVSGKVLSSDLKDGEEVKTLEGSKVNITIKASKIQVNKALVTKADVLASNGVVHMIDAVLLPPGFVLPTSIPDLAGKTAELSTLVAALKAADLVSTLEATGPFTVFAPTDDAFKALPAGDLKKLLEPANIKSLQQVLKYHVVSGKVLSSDLKDGEEVTTLEGSKVKITIKASKVQVNKALVTKADVLATNGVVHLINAVLLPPGFVVPPTSVEAAQIVV